MRFVNTPPMVGVPRPADNVPEDVELPVLEDVDPSANVPEEAGLPDGLPMIPVEATDNVADEAEDVLDGIFL